MSTIIAACIFIKTARSNLVGKVETREFVIVENIRLVCLLDLTADFRVTTIYADLRFKYLVEESET